MLCFIKIPCCHQEGSRGRLPLSGNLHWCQHHYLLSKNSIAGGRNEDVPGGLPMGVPGHGHQFKGHGCDTLHPEGQVGS